MWMSSLDVVYCGACCMLFAFHPSPHLFFCVDLVDMSLFVVVNFNEQIKWRFPGNISLYFTEYQPWANFFHSVEQRNFSTKAVWSGMYPQLTVTSKGLANALKDSQSYFALSATHTPCSLQKKFALHAWSFCAKTKATLEGRTKSFNQNKRNP